jgi:hypothetical protein
MSSIDDALARHAYLLDSSWESAGKFTNRVGYDLRADYVLIRKAGGTRCAGPGGSIDCDKLMARQAPYMIFDIVASAGSASARPTWFYTNHNGHPNVGVEPQPYETAPTTATSSIEPPEPPPAGLTPAEVQAMIDASIAAALVNVAKYGEKVALQSSGGAILCAEMGGPDDYETFTLTGRSSIGPWESWKLHRGNG